MICSPLRRSTKPPGRQSPETRENGNPPRKNRLATRLRALLLYMIVDTLRRECPRRAWSSREPSIAHDRRRRPCSLGQPYSHEERLDSMSVHLVNPSDNSFGTAVITPRWLFVLAAATPREAGDPILVDESLEQVVPESIHPGDIVGISVHTGNALRGYQVGRMARSRGAWVDLWRNSRHPVS
jgi:hypothetical protein